ncbi:MAG: GGDEF domain-containing protein [Gammaproteobacteria bacterium]|nr:GGDEF domain-containing protein [Gammaproteobacteria bacterium]
MFSRDKHDADGNSPTVVDAEAPQTVALEALSDQLLDTLASILRAYGSYGFDIEAMEAAELERRCKAWARHILTGTPAPLEEEEPGAQERTEPVAMDQRRWSDLQQFFRNHRRDEQAAVNGSTEGMRGLISELASGLRSAISDDSAKDDMVNRELAVLSTAVQGNSLDEIRAQLAMTVDIVSRLIRERQHRYEAQLQSMGKRVRNLRADLVAVREKVNLDALTRLHNRGALDEVLARQIDFSFLSGQSMALMMLDLDHFKQINDTYGHPAGDLVLQTVANAIVRVFPRRSDFIARYGGEEFAVILVDVKSDDLATLGERMLEAVRNLSIDYQDNSIRLTCSAGIAVCTPQDSPETLLNRSDMALYQAKQAGRDRAVFAGE